MQSLMWTVAIWGMALLALRYSPRLRGLSGVGRRLSRPELATILILLGTSSIASRTGAADVSANPVVVETALRGVFASAAFVVVVPRLRLPQRKLPGLTALTLYTAVAVVSVLYSVSLLVSLGKAFEMVVGLAIIWAIASSPHAVEELRRLVRLLMVLLGATITTAVVGFFAMPGMFSQIQTRPGFVTRAAMVSPFASGNSLAATGALIAAYSLGRYLNDESADRRWWLIGFAVGTSSTLLAAGRQGVVIWVLSIGALLVVHRRALLGLLIVPASAALLVVGWDTISTAFVRGQNTDLFLTASGRTTFWGEAISAFAEQPIAGYGFGTGRTAVLARIDADFISSLHSGYFEALIGVGLLGTVPLLYATALAIRWSYRRLRAGVDTDLAILMIPLLVQTAVSLGFAAWLLPAVFLFAALVLLDDFEGPAQVRSVAAPVRRRQARVPLNRAPRR
jgi:O-antigen ligase